MSLCISGSAGMGIAESLGITFEQEVYATRVAVNQMIPGTDVVSLIINKFSPMGQKLSLRNIFPLELNSVMEMPFSMSRILS